MSALTEALAVVLADSVTMKFTAHGYHWNVEGEDFAQYHALFETIYEDVDGAIDPLAENIRKMGEYAPFTLSKFIELRSVESKKTLPEPQALAQSLLEMNEGLIASIGTAFAAASSANEQGIANFLAERDDMHKKWRWQLTASIK